MKGHNRQADETLKLVRHDGLERPTGKEGVTKKKKKRCDGPAEARERNKF